MIEIWRNIPGIEGYQASCLGRIRSIDRSIVCANGTTSNRKGKVLKLQKGLRGKYLRVQLKNGGPIHSVHRLIALAWKDNPFNYPIVRHLNDNGLDNRAINLSWGTQAENINESKRGKNNAFPPCMREVIISAYKAGFSKIAIAKYFKITDTSVRRVVQ